MSREYDFSGRMNAAQRQARITRNTGRHVGASAKGWNWTRPELDAGDWYSITRRAAEGWRVASNEARNEFAAACLNRNHNPEDIYDGLAF